jgi:hypothetical protein
MSSVFETRFSKLLKNKIHIIISGNFIMGQNRKKIEVYYNEFIVKNHRLYIILGVTAQYTSI